MSQDRQQYKIQHSLSRLALAKAIKTPEDGDLEAEPWNKSVIFNQPFISDLHKQKHQLLQHRRDKSSELKPQIQANRQYRKTVSRPSPSIEQRMSELSIKKPCSTVETQLTFLPSNSEEEEEKDGDIEDEEGSGGSEVISVIVSKKRQEPVSYRSTRDDISNTSTRGSSSSNTLPLTDEDDIELTPPQPQKVQQQQRQRQQAHVRVNSWITPQDPYQYNTNRAQKQPAQQPYQAQQQKYNSNSRPPSVEVMDPMYYQRLQQQQQYQQQQYQQQLQYQQAMVLQQQQQAYLFSQNPSAFFPFPRGMEEQPIMMTQTSSKRHSTGFSGISNSKQQQQHHVSSKKTTNKMSNTDKRRRAEIMRVSSPSTEFTKSTNRIIALPSPIQNPAMYFQQQQQHNTTPPVMRSNNNISRRTSYHF